MNVLITGGAGNLASRLVCPLVRRGDRVVLLGIRRHKTAAGPLPDGVRFVQADLADSRAILAAVEANRVESIFHLGAVLSAAAEQRPDEAWRVNMDGTRNVLEAARRLGGLRVVFSSTVAAYGPGCPNPLGIDAPQWPVSLYGVTKVAGERLGVYYQHRFGVDFRAVRLPAVVAVGGAGGGASAYASAVFEESVRRGAYEFYVRPTTRMPIMYVADATRAMLGLHDAEAARLARRVYNVAAINPSAAELAAAVLERLPHVRIAYNPDPVRTAIVESWPQRIDDSDAARDWDWGAAYDLQRTADAVIGELLHTTAR